MDTYSLMGQLTGPDEQCVKLTKETGYVRQNAGTEC